MNGLVWLKWNGRKTHNQSRRLAFLEEKRKEAAWSGNQTNKANNTNQKHEAIETHLKNNITLASRE